MFDHDGVKLDEHTAAPLPTLAVTVTVKPTVAPLMLNVMLALPDPSVDPLFVDVVDL